MKKDAPLDQWVGMDSSGFQRYRHWTTPYGYLCGTYASAVLLAYYQDHLDPTIVPLNIRRQFNDDPQALVEFLHLLIQPHGLPTLPFQVSMGLSRYFRFFKLPYRARTTPVGGWHRATKRISEGKPVILGLMKNMGSTYGNHWVVAYAFKEDRDGKRWFKVHDNWGSAEKIIPATWAGGTVSLP